MKRKERKINNKFDYLTSYKLARSCNVVFSEALTLEEFQGLEINDYSTVSKDERQIIYKLNNFNLKKNDTIFTNSYFIKNLFYLLKNLDQELGITLITNQTDHLLHKEIYKLKPKCIKRWFSINVEHEAENLIPVPLGLSNNYSPKNLLPQDFDNFNEMNDGIRKDKVYINFNINTNFKEREQLYENFKEKEWTVGESSNLSKKEYYEKLANHTFALAPWGNGVDTHRIWESLYLGTIPITKYHHTFSTSKDLPILFVNDYSEITRELLDAYLISSKEKKYSYEKLESNYWSSLILNQKDNLHRDLINIKSPKLITLFYLYEYRFKQLFHRYLKILIFYSKKIFKLINLVKK